MVIVNNKNKESHNSAELKMPKQRIHGHQQFEDEFDTHAHRICAHNLPSLGVCIYISIEKDTIDMYLTYENDSQHEQRKQILNRINRMVNNQFSRTQNTHIQNNLKSCCDSFVALIPNRI